MSANLTECPDCRHKVSPKAEWCPGCGSKLQDTQTERFAKLHLAITKVLMTVAILFIGGCVAMGILLGD